MLAFLTDAHLSPHLAEQMRAKHPEIRIESLHTWQDGRLLEAEDTVILAVAHPEGLTLVTYDQRTLVPLVSQWSQEGREHAGVIFIDEQSIAQEDIGIQLRALIALWERYADEDWTNGVMYLRPPAP